MGAKKRIPSPDELRDYDHAVAGHAGTLCDADGELFIKPCTQTEIDFYQAVEVNGYRDFAEIMPVFMGDLQLSTPQDVPLDDALLNVVSDSGVDTSKESIAAKIVEQVAKAVPAAVADCAASWVPTQGKKIKTDKSVVLENASFGYKKANILDVKLGVRLWADDAPAEKKRRFDAISEQTTHGKLGFRISGMKVYHGSGDKAKWDKEGYMVYDKDFGRLTVNDKNVVDAFRTFIFNQTAGIDQALGRAVCSAFVRDLERVEEVLASHETRMYSSSLLFIFEGDGAALSAAIEKNNEIMERESAESYTCPPVSRSNIGLDNRMDSGIVLEDDDDSENGDEDEDDGLQLPKIYTLKLIDFAHAEFTPGLGPDENTLTGVRSLLRIFRELAGEDHKTTST
ncbi:inositol polyphosphate kinase domain-containing protein [Trichoderma longibrachiatum]|uniref:Kinase n=1 Tax=Trichoderma longibrachiatum ATCC 18648 TaxID=983965 RepID=A0A2T4C628_TRILO|nr:SAICAR synthase-like protein [Trichoderma longibrachiatum ATCC 18648]